MKYKMNENFFNCIDCESKAYFLGLMYADGCVQANGNSWRIILSINLCDIDIVQKMKEALDFNGKIYQSNNRSTLQLSSKRLGDGLIKQGCVPNKSLIINYPENVPNKLISHFIRGYFDGNGCLTISDKSARFTIIGTESVIYGITDEFSKIDVHCTVFKNNNNHVLSVSGNRQIKRLLNWLYKDANFYMQRKFDKKEEFNNVLKDIRKIKFRRLESEEKDNIVKSYLEGKKVIDIQKEYKVTSKTIYDILNKKDIKRRQTRRL